MKKIYLISLFLLAVTFVSCNGDDEPGPNLDTESPVLDITTTQDIDTFLIIESVNLKIKVTDNRGINDLQVYLVGPDGTKKLIAESRQTYRFQNHNLSVLMQKGAPTGDYTIIAEARDFELNMAKDSLTITMDAWALDKNYFSRAFINAFEYEFQFFDYYSGYSLSEKGIAFDSFWLSTFLYAMVSSDGGYPISEVYWNRFATDFGVKNQRWATWDENSDGSLSEAEFQSGIVRLKLLEDWDSNQDAVIDGEEMASGFFNYWDFNKDNVLSTEEYLEKFYRYL